MAAFCGNCGSSLGVNAAFCPQCGNQVGAPKAASPTAAAVPMAPVAKSGSGLKIVLVLLVCLVVIGIGVIGATVYVAHRVKQAVVEKASQYGVALPSSDSDTSSRVPEAVMRNPCSLLSKDEAAGILGEPIERTEVQEQGCLYFGPPGLSAKLSKEGMSAILNKKGEPPSPAETADGVDRFMKSMAAQAGQVPDAGTSGDVPLVMVIVGNDGHAQMTALSAGKALMSGMKGASEEIPGLGDRAIRLANLGLNVLKGNAILRVVPGPVPDANRRCVAVAQMVLPRI